MQKFRKFRIAQYIICTFAFVVLLGSSVKANKQNPLKLLSIQNGDTVTLRWEANTPSSEIDSSPSLLDGQGSTIHDVAEFQAYLECISTNGDKKYAGSYGNSATEAELPATLIDSGYVYKATVSPVHYHSYEDAEGVRIGAAARTGEEDKYVYFISKPNMELSASGNDITVEFDDAGDYVKYKI
ncbi:MAG: hypothetical protein MJ246_08610 [Clostridia bacterium]|nr:hypothetical protein [Clostridia bacterium]